MSHARILAASNLADNHQSEEGILAFSFSASTGWCDFLDSDRATVTAAAAAGRDPDPLVWSRGQHCWSNGDQKPRSNLLNFRLKIWQNATSHVLCMGAQSVPVPSAGWDWSQLSPREPIPPVSVGRVAMNLSHVRVVRVEYIGTHLSFREAKPRKQDYRWLNTQGSEAIEGSIDGGSITQHMLFGRAIVCVCVWMCVWTRSLCSRQPQNLRTSRSEASPNLWTRSLSQPLNQKTK